MKKKLFSLCLMIMLAFVYLNGEASNTAVVEIANFYCPHCFSVNACVPVIEKKLQRLHGQFDVVPIYMSGISPWPSRVYLGLQQAVTVRIREALFDAVQTQGLSLQSPLSVCDVIQQTGLNLSLQRCVHQAQSPRVQVRLNRVLKLMRAAKLNDQSYTLPIFIIEKSHHITRVLSYHEFQDANRLCEGVRDALD
jgi:hypothetical protein